MNTIENQIYRATSVEVDNTVFENCVFEGASLVFAGGSLPRFVDCQFHNVSLEFTDAAANTLSFLSGLRKGGFAPAVDKILKGVRRAG